MKDTFNYMIRNLSEEYHRLDVGRENLNFSRFWICCSHKDIVLGMIISLK